MRSNQSRQRAKQPKAEVVARALHPLVSNPREEYCLALLLQYPELKNRCEDLSPEYFQGSENREILIAWQETGDMASLKENLDLVIHEHLDNVISKNLPAKNVEQRYSDCVLQLRKQYLRNLEARRAEMLTLEREMGGEEAELARQKQDGIESSQQMNAIFIQKNQRR